VNIKIQIDTGFVKDGGTGSKWKVIKINESDLEEFRLKRDSLEPDMGLEDFIIHDITSLIENEIDNGLYGIFNY
tara:strand:+ start:1865 stop:2086 length:222 start_codon:yes stop_codon:yes gene_type:complete